MTLIAFSPSSYASTVFIVKDGRPSAEIIIPQNATAKLNKSARILVSYIRKSTGAVVPIRKSVRRPASTFAGKTLILLGWPNSEATGKVHQSMIGDERAVISASENGMIIIAGTSDRATQNAIFKFIEIYIGVRWLLPGANGEHVPLRSNLVMPVQKEVINPRFWARELSGIPQTTWAARNGMLRSIRFHHNLHRLFPPEKYKHSHPEFFPVIRGKRYFPPKKKAYDWQPCFQEPALVSEAVKNITEYFSRYPQRRYYSLGINDSKKYCKCKRCAKQTMNFLKHPHLSELYFKWANAVVDGVLRKYPDKWFGCLAYFAIAEPPEKVDIHPRIIPYLTYDRMKWIVPDLAEFGHKLTRRWADKASVLGWYDYIYGTPYLLPRIYFHKMAENYRFGFGNKVRAIYAESYPNWGEGPKLYLALKLMWDPYLDVDAVLDEWYVAAVGNKAAPSLKAYYDHWEHFWTVRILKSKWFTRQGTWLNFTSPRYLELLTFEDIAKSRRWLEKTVRDAVTAKQQVRAKLILKAFEYYEASALSYLGLIEKKYQHGKNRKYYQEMNRKRLELINEFADDPVLVHPRRFDDKRFKPLRMGIDLQAVDNEN
jgi:hypothetical protein